MSEMSTKIRLINCNGKCMLWNANDAVKLREEYRIVGNLIGCLPRAPRQNNHLGLPLQLSPEETTLLLEKGGVVIVKEPSEVVEATPEQIDTLKQHRKDSYVQQIDLFKEERRQEMQRNLPDIIEGKKAKQRKLLEGRRAAGEIIDEAEFEKDIDFNIEDISIPDIPEENSLIQLHAEHPWQREEETVVDWLYPSSESEKLRYQVFKDLWEKGHWLTSGSKFGGDFLVYPGDPARFHSFYIAICVPYKQKMSALDVIAMGRLGSNVKKTVVLCSLDENDRLVYTSLQWTGIS